MASLRSTLQKAIAETMTGPAISYEAIAFFQSSIERGFQNNFYPHSTTTASGPYVLSAIISFMTNPTDEEIQIITNAERNVNLAPVLTTLQAEGLPVELYPENWTCDSIR